MEVLHPRCCGLDVHKETVVACLRLVIEGKAVKEARTFSTTTADLMALSEWLTENQCTHIAMEATGVYWKPVWHILDDGEFELVLANAAHIKNVPGRKSDVKDADWVSDLLAHGLIRASFVPDSPTQEMRTLMRTRKQLSREQAKDDRGADCWPARSRQIGPVSRSPGTGFARDLAAGPEWPRDPAAPLPVAASPRSDQWPRCRNCQDRPGGGGSHCALSHRRRAIKLGAGRQEPRCTANPLRDRHGHEPFSQRCQSRLLGLHLPAQRRERGQAALHAHSQGLALAQDGARAERPLGGAHEGHLLPGPIPPHPIAARRQESNRGGGGFYAHRHLSHAQGRNDVSGSWYRSLRSPYQGTAEEPPR